MEAVQFRPAIQRAALQQAPQKNLQAKQVAFSADFEEPEEGMSSTTKTVIGAGLALAALGIILYATRGKEAGKVVEAKAKPNLNETAAHPEILVKNNLSDKSAKESAQVYIDQGVTKKEQQINLINVLKEVNTSKANSTPELQPLTKKQAAMHKKLNNNLGIVLRPSNSAKNSAKVFIEEGSAKKTTEAAVHSPEDGLLGIA